MGKEEEIRCFGRSWRSALLSGSIMIAGSETTDRRSWLLQAVGASQIILIRATVLMPRKRPPISNRAGWNRGNTILAGKRDHPAVSVQALRIKTIRYTSKCTRALSPSCRFERPFRWPLGVLTVAVSKRCFSGRFDFFCANHFEVVSRVQRNGCGGIWRQ